MKKETIILLVGMLLSLMINSHQISTFDFPPGWNDVEFMSVLDNDC